MFRRVMQNALFAVFLILVTGCTTMDSGSSATQGFTFSQQSSHSQARDLAPKDGIEISVEVDGTMEVSLHRAEINHQGMVTLPLVGDVKIGGMKLAEARDVIAKTYGAYYVNPPVVMLTLTGSDEAGEWGFVTVLGRVIKPGRVPLASQEGINLSAAVQMAGGFAPSAKTSEIRITRADELGMRTQVTVDFKQIGQKGNSSADILLIEDDIVYVPERIF